MGYGRHGGLAIVGLDFHAVTRRLTGAEEKQQEHGYDDETVAHDDLLFVPTNIVIFGERRARGAVINTHL